MSLSKEERKAALKKRMQDAAHDRDKKGLGRKSVIDLSIVSSKDDDKKVNFFKPTMKKGEKNLIDLIPFTVSQDFYSKLRAFSGRPTGIEVGEWDYKLEVPVHRNVGVDNATFLCLSMALGKACPVCEERQLEYDKKEDADEDKIKSLYYSWRCFYTIWDYNDEEKDLQLFECSYAMFEKNILDEADLGDKGIVLFSDLDDGMSIEFKAKEKTLGKSKFFEAQSIEFKDRESIEEDMVDDAFPLDKMLIIPTYEDVKKALYNEGDDGEGDKKEESKPSRGRGRGRKEPDEEPKDEKSTEPEDGEGESEGEDGECPAGGDFGKDCNELDECAKCPDDTFDACATAQDELKKSKPKKEDKPKRTRGGTDKKEEKKNESGGRKRRSRG